MKVFSGDNEMQRMAGTIFLALYLIAAGFVLSVVSAMVV
jgi:hypothetical protein